MKLGGDFWSAIVVADFASCLFCGFVVVVVVVVFCLMRQ